jgi:hypothetical protein
MLDADNKIKKNAKKIKKAFDKYKSCATLGKCQEDWHKKSNNHKKRKGIKKWLKV